MVFCRPDFAIKTIADQGGSDPTAALPRRPRALAALGLAASLTALVALGGCGGLPKPPERPVVYDLGPLPVTALANPPAVPGLPVALVMAEPAEAMETVVVLYRLGYDDAQVLRPYALARWSRAPALLLRQRLREHIGHYRPVTNLGEAEAPLRLQIEIEEFSQHFTSPQNSTGRVRLRATLIDNTAGGLMVSSSAGLGAQQANTGGATPSAGAGERSGADPDSSTKASAGSANASAARRVQQRIFAAEKPAPSADAAGGIHALALATNDVAAQVADWLNQASATMLPP